MGDLDVGIRKRADERTQQELVFIKVLGNACSVCYLRYNFSDIYRRCPKYALQAFYLELGRCYATTVLQMKYIWKLLG